MLPYFLPTIPHSCWLYPAVNWQLDLESPCFPKGTWSSTYHINLGQPTGWVVAAAMDWGIVYFVGLRGIGMGWGWAGNNAPVSPVGWRATAGLVSRLVMLRSRYLFKQPVTSCWCYALKSSFEATQLQKLVRRSVPAVVVNKTVDEQIIPRYRTTNQLSLVVFLSQPGSVGANFLGWEHGEDNGEWLWDGDLGWLWDKTSSL